MSKTLIEKLSRIQSKLKAPKSQFNKFGNYAYRNQEDILEAVKPLLVEEGLAMTIQDEIVHVNEQRVYVKAIVKVTDGESTVENSAFARESLDKKGMDDAQITGSTSSYARKYALNGMFLIDDTRDADATNDHGKGESQSVRSSVSSSTNKASGDLDKPVPAVGTTTGKKSFRQNKPTQGSEDL